MSESAPNDIAWRDMPPAWRAYGVKAEEALAKQMGEGQVVLAYALTRPANVGRYFLVVMGAALGSMVGLIALFVLAAKLGPIAVGVLVALLLGGLLAGWIYLWVRLFAEWSEATQLGVGSLSKVFLPLVLIGFAGIAALTGAIFLILERTGVANGLVVRTPTHLAVLKMRPMIMVPRLGPAAIFPLDTTQVMAGKDGMLTMPLTLTPAGGPPRKLVVFRRIIGTGVSPEFADRNLKALTAAR